MSSNVVSFLTRVKPDNQEFFTGEVIAVLVSNIVWNTQVFQHRIEMHASESSESIAVFRRELLDSAVMVCQVIPGFHARFAL